MIKYVLGEYSDTMPVYILIDGNAGYFTTNLEDATKFVEIDKNLSKNNRFMWMPYFDVSDLVEE